MPSGTGSGLVIFENPLSAFLCSTCRKKVEVAKFKFLLANLKLLCVCAKSGRRNDTERPPSQAKEEAPFASSMVPCPRLSYSVRLDYLPYTVLSKPTKTWHNAPPISSQTHKRNLGQSLARQVISLLIRWRQKPRTTPDCSRRICTTYPRARCPYSSAVGEGTRERQPGRLSTRHTQTGSTSRGESIRL